MRQTTMNTIPDFHDGFFDGLLVSNDKRIHVFLRTTDQERFTMILYGVRLLKASNVRQGNIILDLVLVNPQQLTGEHIEELYDIAGARRDEQIEQFLASAREEELSVLEVSSSYGAECIALFRRAEFRTNHLCSVETQ
jgi:hypothetical protein